MDLLFKRAQSTGAAKNVIFKLWGKIEFDEEEKAISKRYRFDEAILIYVEQPNLLQTAVSSGIGVFVLALAAYAVIFPSYVFAGVLAIATGIAFAYWYYHEKRETIYVKDLLHGRHFSCDSVVELARKEAWLETLCAFLRQVMESAKHWDGEVRTPIAALPKEEARRVIIQGF